MILFVTRDCREAPFKFTIIHYVPNKKIVVSTLAYFASMLRDVKFCCWREGCANILDKAFLSERFS